MMVWLDVFVSLFYNMGYAFGQSSFAQRLRWINWNNCNYEMYNIVTVEFET